MNASTRQFGRGLASTVTSALRTTGADPNDLVIELTESTIVDDTESVAAALTELRELGVRSAIDDFGTGYCGLRYLSALPVASLKIDRSFVQTMTPSGAAIVAATIAMGKSLGPHAGGGGRRDARAAALPHHPGLRARRRATCSAARCPPTP